MESRPKNSLAFACYIEDGDRMEELESIRPTAQLVMEANGFILYPDLEDNPSAEELFRRLRPNALDLTLEDRDGAEKSGLLPWNLPFKGTEFDADLGDIFLRGENVVSICYGEGVKGTVRLARIRYKDADEIAEILGCGDTAVSFWLEWSE